MESKHFIFTNIKAQIYYLIFALDHQFHHIITQHVPVFVQEMFNLQHKKIHKVTLILDVQNFVSIINAYVDDCVDDYNICN